jgi:hypothetical protein
VASTEKEERPFTHVHIRNVGFVSYNKAFRVEPTSPLSNCNGL